MPGRGKKPPAKKGRKTKAASPNAKPRKASGAKERRAAALNDALEARNAVRRALQDARIGNQFWRARSSHGPNPKFKKAQELFDSCCQYFEWVEANPLMEEKIVAGPVGPERIDVCRMRAMTLGGLCLFLGITQQTWRDWRNAGTDLHRKDLADVIDWTETVIYTQKFEGAAAGLINANIISRDLGLVDKREDTHQAGDTLTAFMREIAGQPLFGKAA